MHAQGQRVKHFSPEAIQDNEGGGTRKETRDIREPQIVDDNCNDRTRDREQELTNQVMEENVTLQRKLKESEAERLEALAANKKWLEYSGKLEKELEMVREENQKLKLEMLAEEARAAEKQSMQSAGASVDQLEQRNQWLEEDNKMLRDQLHYIQSRLRNYEIQENMPPGPPEWQCKRCTLLNPGNCVKCAACGMKGPKRFLGFGKLEVDGPAL